MSDASKTNEALIAELRRSPSIDVQTVIDLMAQAADALEAATRVPVQGEPNDDREALLEADELYDSIGVTLFRAEFRETYTKLSRVTVPDAANEELSRIKPLFENLSREYPNECNKRVRAEAERDAATAAIGRVRAAVEGPHPANSGLDSFTLAHILAELDGAPEPEWQYSRGVLHSNGLLEVGVTLPPGRLVNVRRRKAGPWLPVEGESK